MWISIMGMYEYDNTVFDGFNAPSFIDDHNNVHTLNRDDVINNILLHCSELELVYPSFEMMKFAIGVWSASNERSWDKLYKSMYLEYNPIWNVDANETETETNEHEIGRTKTETDTERISLTDLETRNLSDSENINITDTESVQGFNSNTWSESKKVAKNGTDATQHTGTDEIKHTGNNSAERVNEESINDENMKNNTKRRTGNIGVTATQDLIKKEREIADFSIVEFITQSFKERFCLLIY